MDRLECRANKVASFGGDDGVEFISAEAIRSWIDSYLEGEDLLVIDVSASELALMVRDSVATRAI